LIKREKKKERRKERKKERKQIDVVVVFEEA